MNKSQSSDFNDKNNGSSTDNSNLNKIAVELRSQISLISYEQSLKELDILLEEMQSNNVTVEELQKHYLKAKLYLEHCERLLDNVEQKVTEMEIMPD